MNGRLLVCAILMIAAASTAYFQDQYDDLPKVMHSILLSDLQTRAQAEPKISAKELAAYANNKLAEIGYAYSFDPCDVESAATKIKYPTDNDDDFFHVYNTVDVTGKKLSFLASQPYDAPCGCSIDLPITSATPMRLAIVAQERRLEIAIPAKLLFEEIELVDASMRKTIRRWVIPDGGPPDAISIDGRKIYMQIESTPLYLEVPPNGTLKIVPRNSLGLIRTFTDLKRYPKDPNNAYLGFRRFSNGKIYKFSWPCT